jgi:hypothetical protein
VRSNRSIAGPLRAAIFAVWSKSSLPLRAEWCKRTLRGRPMILPRAFCSLGVPVRPRHPTSPSPRRGDGDSWAARRRRQPVPPTARTPSCGVAALTGRHPSRPGTARLPIPQPKETARTLHRRALAPAGAIQIPTLPTLRSQPGRGCSSPRCQGGHSARPGSEGPHGYVEAPARSWCHAFPSG